jgi:hypothetical protein
MITLAELFIVSWCRTLNELEQQALEVWLTTGDTRLMLCLSLFRRNFHQIAKIATPEC